MLGSMRTALGAKYRAPATSGPISARYWRFVMPVGVVCFNGAINWQMRRFSLYASTDATGTDAALNQPVDADDSQTGYPPTNANDGTNAFWVRPTGLALPGWWSVDLGAAVEVKSLYSASRNNTVAYLPTEMWLQASDDNVNWSTVMVINPPGTSGSGIEEDIQ